MRVLLLGPYPPPNGGVQTNLVAIRRLLLERGISCQVINLTRFRQPDHDGIFFPAGALDLLQLLLRLRFDIVHLHIGGDLSPRLLGLGLVCCALPGVKTVLTFHSGGYPASPAGQASHPRTFRAFVLRSFDRVIAVNEQLRRMFIEQFALPAERVRFLYPHALPSRVPDVPLPPPTDHFFATHDPVLLSMGWLEPEYDFALQIAALGDVRRRHPRAGLVIFGEGRLQTELQTQIAATSYPGDVHMPGDLSHDTALAAIARCDIFLRTTHYDGDSISVREALHFSTPVIASDNGMRPAGVRLVPARDKAALVAAIDAQLQQPRPPVNPQLSLVTDHIESVLRLYQEFVSS